MAPAFATNPSNGLLEIPHAEVGLDRVRVEASAVLPGDGYADYVKPFRTIEDAHVHCALLGYLVARHVWHWNRVWALAAVLPFLCLDLIFFGANILAGISALLAARIADRIGLINTMVFTHIPSNALLFLVPDIALWLPRTMR